MSDINLKKLRFDNNLSQEELGKILNITKQQISKIENGKAKLTKKSCELIEKSFGLCVDDVESDSIIELDYFSSLTIKNGNMTDLNPKRKIKLPLNFFPWKKDTSYFVCHAVGKSMEPIIYDGDFLVIEKKLDKNIETEIEDGRIYLFSYGDKVYLKELSININQLVVKSLNPDFSIQYINHDEFKKVGLIGKVICHGRLCNNNNY